MSTRIRVARLDELPPGAGRFVLVGARVFAVFNLEGRLGAVRVQPSPHVGGPDLPGHASPCVRGEGSFDATHLDSPARAHEGAELPVEVEDDYVVLSVEQAMAD